MSQIELRASATGAELLPALGGSDPAMLTIRDMAGLERIRHLWEASSAAADWSGPMHQHGWARAYAEVYGIERDLVVLAACARREAAIAPLFRRRKGLVHRLEFIGLHELDEPMDLVYSTPAELPAVADAIADLAIPVVLRRIRADSPALPALHQAFRNRGIVLCRPVTGCPWIALDESWRDPGAHINSGRRSDLRRARRIAREHGELTCDILSPAPAELPALLDDAFRLEATGWKKQHGSALICQPLQAEFFRRYAAAAAARGSLRLCFLRIAGRPVAMQYAVETGGRFWLLRIGFDDAFARCSPGTLLMLETIRYAANAGLRSYEFLGEIDPWIETWTKNTHPCLSFRAYPFNAAGMICLARDGAYRLRSKLAGLGATRPAAKA